MPLLPRRSSKAELQPLRPTARIREAGLSCCGHSGSHQTMPQFVVDVNGTRRTLQAASDETLLSVLRDRLDLTGAKYGCGEGQCGACTVHMNGRAVRSCQTTIEQAAGTHIVTVEGLEHDGKLTPVQQAFLDEGAFQ